jgi:hypothetical protein
MVAKMVDKVRRKENEVPVISGFDQFIWYAAFTMLVPEMHFVSGSFIDLIKTDLYRLCTDLRFGRQNGRQLR